MKRTRALATAAGSGPTKRVKINESKDKSVPVVLTNQRDQVIDRLVKEKTNFSFKDAFWTQEKKRVLTNQAPSKAGKLTDKREFSFVKAGKHAKNVK